MTARSRSLPFAAILASTALLLTGSMATALAAAPSNDDIAGATVVGAVPFTDGPVDTRDATTSAADPGFCYDATEGADRHTVWYAFTPSAAGRYEADTFTSTYDTTVYVGTANGSGGIDVIGCNDDTNGLQSAVGWQGAAGTTYLIMVGSCCGATFGDGGSLTLHVDVAPPAPQVSLSVSSRGSFSRYGVATISGTVACQNADIVDVDLSVAQAVGRKSIFGGGFVEVRCSSTATGWSIDVSSEDGKFLGGHVTVDAFADACGAIECATDSRTLTVNLRH